VKAPVLLRIQFALQVIGAAAVITYCVALRPNFSWQIAYLAVLLMAAQTTSDMLPLTVIRAGTRLQFTGDGMVVVAAVLLLPTSYGTLTIVAGSTVGLLIRREPSLLELHNLAGITISGFLSLTIAHLIGSAGLTPQCVIGALVGYEVCDFCTLTLVSFTAQFRMSATFWDYFKSGVSGSVFIAPWVMSVGVLLGAIGTAIPWALPLTAAPLALVFLASRARVEASEDRTRLDSILGATTAILEATTLSMVVETATHNAADLFESETSRIDSEPPKEGELGAALASDRLGTQYLIIGTRRRMMHSFTERDRRMLDTLASITASALDKAAQHEDITEQATTDALTGLPNRRSFEEQVRVTLTGMRSSDGAGIIFVDLDKFKQINDVHGHQAGDEVLVEAAKRLNASVRGGDVVARLGGDEFTILLRGVHHAGDATLVADRVLESMRLPMRLTSGVEVSTTPSIGIALALQGDIEPVQLLKDADAAMYEAKRAGKDCWRLFSRGVRVA
jgi:diguanylate cyclase (GGDEF)-like protein